MVAHHDAEIERAGRLIQGPESFGTIRIEFCQMGEGRLRKMPRREPLVVERAQQRERVEPRVFEPRAQIGGHRRGALGHAAPRTSRN